MGFTLTSLDSDPVVLRDLDAPNVTKSEHNVTGVILWHECRNITLSDSDTIILHGLGSGVWWPCNIAVSTKKGIISDVTT